MDRFATIGLPIPLDLQQYFSLDTCMKNYWPHPLWNILLDNIRSAPSWKAVVEIQKSIYKMPTRRGEAWLFLLPEKLFFFVLSNEKWKAVAPTAWMWARFFLTHRPFHLGSGCQQYWLGIFFGLDRLAPRPRYAIWSEIFFGFFLWIWKSVAAMPLLDQRFSLVLIKNQPDNFIPLYYNIFFEYTIHNGFICFQLFLPSPI